MSCRYYIYAPPATPVSVIAVSDVNYIILSKLTLLRPVELSTKFDTVRLGWSIVYIEG